MGLESHVEVSVVYQWKPVKCGDRRTFGHNQKVPFGSPPSCKKQEDLIIVPYYGMALACRLKVGSTMESLTSPVVGDGQLVGVIDQLQPAAEFLCDSDLKPLSLKLADVVCELKLDVQEHSPSPALPLLRLLLSRLNLFRAIYLKRSNAVDLLGGNGIHMPRAATGLAKCMMQFLFLLIGGVRLCVGDGFPSEVLKWIGAVASNSAANGFTDALLVAGHVKLQIASLLIILNELRCISRHTLINQFDIAPSKSGSTNQQNSKKHAIVTSARPISKNNIGIFIAAFSKQENAALQLHSPKTSKSSCNRAPSQQHLPAAALSFPSLQKVGQLKSSGRDAIFLESLQTLVCSPIMQDAGVADRCLGSPPSEHMGLISEGVEAVPLSDGSIASVPIAFHGTSHSPSGMRQSPPQPSWAAVVQISDSKADSQLHYFPPPSVDASDAGSARIVEVGVKYHWKSPRCASCKKSGHSVAQCKARTLSNPNEVSKSVSDSYPSIVDVEPGKPSGFHEEEIDALGDIRRLENMKAPSPTGCKVSTILQIEPGECNSLSLLQDPRVSDVKLSNNTNRGDVDSSISSQVTNLARSDVKGVLPAHSDSGAAALPCSYHNPTLSGLTVGEICEYMAMRTELTLAFSIRSALSANWTELRPHGTELISRGLTAFCIPYGRSGCSVVKPELSCELHTDRSKLPVRPGEENCMLLVDRSFSRFLMDFQPPPSDAVILDDERTSSSAEVVDHDSIVPPFDEVESKMAKVEARIAAREALPNSASRIASNVERLRRKLVELKAQHCPTLSPTQMPYCSQAAHGNVPEDPPTGYEAAALETKFRDDAEPPTCFQGPSIEWDEVVLFAKQAVIRKFPKDQHRWKPASKHPKGSIAKPA
ncbi:hypothetical protein Nepgr_007905 [Nepenthes gracilis]|uniref:Uncharacterized protein n=1 Tax=Nepenthes gracilis TaxID=150966 RepID=A0AAD3S7V0_NEPGR|nr:hypothetical protein Nepgr_007905 [Nepenthes gracilis]